ncbi:MAG: ATP synthase F1 subunit delta [Candidatus Moranbacteria bacterium]|nr:ATP synthase F1 subunit delta [Candidatus Moranbacteria bacterium]
MKYTATQYAKTLYEITKGRGEQEIKDDIAGFLRLLVKNGDMRLRDAVIKRFGEIYDAKNGIIEAEVVSREKLDAAMIDKLTGFIKDKYGANEVVIKNKIDEKIDGGIIIKVGDELMDGSIARQLAKMRNKLIA